MPSSMLRIVTISTVAATHAVLTGPASSLEVNNRFHEFVTARGRAFGAEEYSNRRELFARRLQLISVQNSKPDRLWTAGVNELTDRTDDELESLRGWRRVGGPKGHASRGASLLAESSKVVEEPVETVDWRNLSMAQVVPNQGGCGSCWAVATASMLQGRSEVQMGSGRSFSAQQLVDCVPNPKDCGGSGGCDGATVELAMGYVERMGLGSEEEVPYMGTGNVCQKKMPEQKDQSAGSSFLSTFRRNGGYSQVGLQSWHKLPENQALPLMLAVAEGPVAVSVGAGDWFPYSSGIFNGCSKDAVIDHAVVLFGYGKGTTAEKNENYWLVRNSWGNSWGENGFIRLLRSSTTSEDDSFCGTDHDPKAGVACKPYPDAVKVCGQCGILYDSVAAHFGGLAPA